MFCPFSFSPPIRTATAMAPPRRVTVNSQPTHLKLREVSLFLVTINFSPLDIRQDVQFTRHNNIFTQNSDSFGLIRWKKGKRETKGK